MQGCPVPPRPAWSQGQGHPHPMTTAGAREAVAHCAESGERRACPCAGGSRAGQKGEGGRKVGDRPGGMAPPASLPCCFPGLCHHPAPHFHMTPCPMEPPQTSQTGPSPSPGSPSPPLRSEPHRLSPGAFPFYAVSAQHQPRLSTSWVPSFPLALGPACRSPSHPSPGQTTQPSHPSGLAPDLTIGLGPLRSPQGLCRAPGSPKPGGTAGVLRVFCHTEWDQPGRGIQDGFLKEEFRGPCLLVLTLPTWLTAPSRLGLSLRVCCFSSIKCPRSLAGWQDQWTLGPRTVPCCTNSGTPLSLDLTVCEEEPAAQTAGAPGLSSPGPAPKTTEEGLRSLARRVFLRVPLRPQPHPCPSPSLFPQL